MISILSYPLLTAFVLFLVIIGLVIVYKKTLIHVESVKAGLIDDVHALCNNCMTSTISLFDVFYYDGKKVDPRNYVVRKVDGDCMSPRGINGGNTIFIHKFKNGEKEKITKGDILYIKYERDGFSGYKIREFVGFTDDKQDATTLFYSHEGKEKPSSQPHNVKNIIGVVKMKFD